MVQGKLIGEVVRARMQKSVLVKVPFWQTLRIYNKRVVRHTKLMAHDEFGCQEGDTVRLGLAPSMSKRKHHRVLEVLRRAPQW
mmetsp:Transcript_27586/g.81093  ORF Transcript_27586/g.81093 Transcript_27586/m.81093 type:complete len:83 (+) Transcript_27586:38-286(+)